MGKYHILNLGFIGLVLLLTLPFRTVADLQMGLAIDKLSASGWVMENISLEFGFVGTTELSAHLTAASFKHDALPGGFKQIRLDCSVQRVQQRYLCTDGRMSIADSPYGPQQFQISGEFVDSEQIKLHAQGLRLAQGRVGVEVELNEGHWDLALNGARINLGSLKKHLATDLVPKDADLSGYAKLVAQLSGFKAKPKGLGLMLQVDKFAYADVEGLHVVEDGEFRLEVNAKREGPDSIGDSQLTLTKGQFYTDPFYVEVAEKPLSAQFRGQWNPIADMLQIHDSRVVVPQVMESQASVRLDTSSGEILQAEVDLHSEHVGNLYSVFLQPMLIGGMADDVEASGVLDAEIGLKDGRLQGLRAKLGDIHLDDRKGLFALYGLNGSLAWSRESHPDRSQFTIQGGQLYRIDFGPAEVHAHAQQGEVTLEQPLDLPLLHGNLQIKQLHAQGLLDNAPQWRTSAEIKGISLQAVTEAFEWPPMQGELHGTIPNVHYQQKRMGMDGELVIDVFGGSIRMGKLLIKEPLGRVPELFADLQLSGLDLAQITQTFSFGHIQGGLEGEIADLHLASWEPIAFNARFNTPDSDKTPHRISQRAVDNLTALGNGVGSGLSSTFLGIFKEFRYNRIELKAKLDGNVAQLDGMGHPDGGYYIVKGSGLPRIDVIARNRQVAWKTLLERLKSIRVEGMQVR
jgi:hypothetical protein